MHLPLKYNLFRKKDSVFLGDHSLPSTWFCVLFRISVQQMFNFPLGDCWSHCRNNLCLFLFRYITQIYYSVEYSILGSSEKILIWSVPLGKLDRGSTRSSHHILVIASSWTNTKISFLIFHSDHLLSFWSTDFSEHTDLIITSHPVVLLYSECPSTTPFPSLF